MRRLWLFALALGLAGATFGVVYGLSKDSNRSIQTQCDGTCVALYADKADPEVLTVTKDSFVQFNSADGQKYNLTTGGDNGVHHDRFDQYNSGDFKAGEAWRVQFKQDGAYSFKDIYHPKIKLNVVVYTPGKDYKIK